MELELKSDTFSLTLKFVDVVKIGDRVYDWCHLYLNLCGREIFLGAEEKSILVKKILYGITTNSEIFDNRRGSLINGNHYFYFLGLAEGKHLMCYVRELNAGIELLFINGLSGNQIGTVQLSEAEHRSWKEQLKSIYCKTPLNQNQRIFVRLER